MVLAEHRITVVSSVIGGFKTGQLQNIAIPSM
jgi:hypothetical protein